MDLSVIIVNYNVFEDVKECIHGIKKYLKELKFEIIVIDNHSSDNSINDLPNIYPGVILIRLGSNKGFGSANNIGMKIAKGKYFLLVNPDILFVDNSIEKMHDFVSKNESVGIVGPVQYKPNTGIEYYYTYFPSIYSRLMQENRLYMKTRKMKKRFFEFLNENIKKGLPFRVDWVIGSCLMARREVFEKIGGFDEAFFLFEEETEWQFRMKQQGWVTYMLPDARVLHNHHSSVSKIGRIFVYYHEFRSRIIFDHKRFKGFKYFIRILLIDVGLALRVIYFSFRSIFDKKLLIKLKAYFDLFIFNNMSKETILNSRYDFDEKRNLFV